MAATLVRHCTAGRRDIPLGHGSRAAHAALYFPR